MTVHLEPPPEDVVRGVVRATFPVLVDAPITVLGQGWAFTAYQVGDIVLRFPLDARWTESLRAEAAVMQELAPRLPLRVSAIEVHDGGPNGLPFTSHAAVPGVPVRKLTRPLSERAGAVLGSFYRSMHDFPTERATVLGLPDLSVEASRASRIDLYERVREQVLPLVDETTAAYTRQRFEEFLNEPANFRWTPRVSHADIDANNVLADPDTGELTGVIDWGDITVGDPGGEFSDILYGGLGDAGLRSQLPSLLAAYGMQTEELDAMRPRCRFYNFCWPLHEVLHGLDSGNEGFVDSGLEWLLRFARDGDDRPQAAS